MTHAVGGNTDDGSHSLDRHVPLDRHYLGLPTRRGRRRLEKYLRRSTSGRW